jgi:hypothetical protein
MTHWILWLCWVVYFLLGFFWMGANKEITASIWKMKEEDGGDVTKLFTIGIIITTWIFWLAWQIGEYFNEKYKEFVKR